MTMLQDGSSYWTHKENFVVYGQAGFKADFGAHNMHAVGNYYAYVDVAWGGWPSTDGRFLNNSVILGGETTSYFGIGYASDCGLIGHPESGLIGGNTVHSKDAATMMVSCLNESTKSCSSVCRLSDWIAVGHDQGTTIRPIPRDKDVIAAGRHLLGMSTAAGKSDDGDGRRQDLGAAAVGPPTAWTPRGITGGGAFFSPAFHPTNPNIMTVTTDMGVVFRTSTMGDTWQSLQYAEIGGGRPAQVRFTAGKTAYAVNGRSGQKPDGSAGGYGWMPAVSEKM